jgi:hypothetical protein
MQAWGFCAIHPFSGFFGKMWRQRRAFLAATHRNACSEGVSAPMREKPLRANRGAA